MKQEQFQTKEITQVISQAEVTKASSDAIILAFQPIVEQANELKTQALSIEVTHEDQKDLMEQAKELRGQLRAQRIKAQNTKKEMKEESLKYGRAVQSAYNFIEGVIKPLEEHLKNQEDFVIIQTNKRMKELRESREPIVEPLREFIPAHALLQLGQMSDDEFQITLTSAKLMKEHKEQEEKKAEEQRREEERLNIVESSRLINFAPFTEYFPDHNYDFRTMSDSEFNEIMIEADDRKQKAWEDQERIKRERAELETKLEKERLEMEAKLKRERAEAEAKLEKEREAKKRLQAKMRKQREQERKAQQEQEQKRRDAESSSDAAKLRAFANTLREIKHPTVSHRLALQALRAAMDDIDGICEEMETYAQKIEKTISLTPKSTAA